MLNLIFVLGVICAYGVMFAMTRRSWIGWAITTLAGVTAMIFLILVHRGALSVAGL